MKNEAINILTLPIRSCVLASTPHSLFFLVVDTQLYKRLCLSVCPFICPSITNSGLKIMAVKAHSTEAWPRASVELEFVPHTEIGLIHWSTNSELEIGPIKANSTEARPRASVELEFVRQWIDSWHLFILQLTSFHATMKKKVTQVYLIKCKYFSKIRNLFCFFLFQKN